MEKGKLYTGTLVIKRKRARRARDRVGLETTYNSKSLTLFCV